MLTNDPGDRFAIRPALSRFAQFIGPKVHTAYGKAAAFMVKVKRFLVPLAIVFGAAGVDLALSEHKPLHKPIGLVCAFTIFLSLLFDAPVWARRWRSVTQLCRTLLPCSFAFLSIAMVDGILLANYQGQELLRRLAEDAPPHEVYLFFALSTIWFLEVWYVCRVMLLFVFDGVGKIVDGERVDMLGLRKYMPRITSAIACVGLAGAMLKASFAYGDLRPELGNVRGRMLIFTGILVAFGCGVLAAIIYRRRFAALSAEPWKKPVHSLSDVPFSTRLLVIGAVALSLALVIAIDRRPMEVAWTIGPLGVVVIAAICWVAIASAALYYGLRYHVPVFTLAVIALFAFSYFNDNHAVRLKDDIRPRKTLRKAFDDWAVAKLAAEPANPNRIPVFIVAAEGGGIRAAYWTATVLAHLQAMRSDFADHTFAISGVSGGSLGAMTFTATIADTRARTYVIAKTRKMLSQDFLGPLLGRLLFSDLIQQFMPVPVVRDRARAIEEAWERSWRTNAIAHADADGHVTDQTAFEEPFCNMWSRSGDASLHIPNLFLNGTIVESGNRVVVSNIDVGNSLNDAEDALTLIGGEPSLSTAVHLSARFSYVSPAGLIRRRGTPREEWRHVVDGGYFENSGCTTASEILSIVNQQIQQRPEWRDRFIPIVIVVNHELTRAEHDGNAETFLAEVLSPVRAMLKAREAHATSATQELVAKAGWMNGYAITFKLPHLPVPAPLGWSLSTRVASEIDDCFDPKRVSRCAQITRPSIDAFTYAHANPTAIAQR